MRRFVIVFSCVLIFNFVGCGGGAKDAPSTINVTGIVTYDSQPLADAVVIFDPKSDGKVATGLTNSSGEFSLKTAGTDGVVAGDYNVSVTSSAEVPMPGTEEAKNYNPNSVLPAKYGDPNTSGLTATVSNDKTTFEFTLTKK